MPYAEVFEQFPPELRLPIARLVDALKEELGVRSSDFDELRAIIRELAEAQQRTESRLERVETAVQELAQAQQRTELRVEELAQAQQRTELHMAELAQAQQRTELRVEEFARAQTLFRYTFDSQVGGLGARWGMQTEEAFRQGMRAILQEVGYTTERFLEYDAAGDVFGHPEQVELDVVIKDGKVIVVEIKSSLDRGNTYLFDRKVAFYSQRTSRQADRKLIITPFADTRAKEVALQLGVEICTDITALS